VTLAFHVLWILCALGTVVFAAVAARQWSQVATAAVAFALVAFAGPTEPNAAAVGVAAAMGAAVVLWRRFRFAAVSGVALGVLAAVWAQALQLQGAPHVAALTAVIVVVVITVWLTCARAGFAPPVLLDDGLLIVIALGLTTASVPVVMDGWQSAATLTAASAATQEMPLPIWLVGALGVSLALGALHSVWSRR
jgi:hypothetical protein